jgi:hypothetical protein
MPLLIRHDTPFGQWQFYAWLTFTTPPVFEVDGAQAA